MTELSYIELWTTSNSPLITINSTYTELQIIPITSNSKTNDWNIGTSGYPQVIYNGTETRKFMCMATISFDVNKNSTTFYTAFSINNNVVGSEKISSVSISGIPEETTISSILELSENDVVSIKCKNNGTVSSTSRISVVRLDLIIHSMQGNQGPSGNDGVNGSGSSIIIKKYGTNITNTPHTSLNFVGNGLEVNDTGSGTATINLSQNIFGQNYHYVEDDSTSITTAEWTEKLKLNTNSLPMGNYKISWYCEISNVNNLKAMTVRCQLNDNVNLSGEIFNSYSPQNFGTNIWHVFSGFKMMTSLSGINTIDLDFGLDNTDGIGSAQIKNARIELFRIN